LRCEYLEVALVVDHQVLGLEVAVGDVTHVEVLEGARDVRAVESGLRLVEAALPKMAGGSEDEPSQAEVNPSQAKPSQVKPTQASPRTLPATREKSSPPWIRSIST
jgi:hypothetical protein